MGFYANAKTFTIVIDFANSTLFYDKKAKHNYYPRAEEVDNTYVTFSLEGVSPSVFRCTSTPMETGPIDACVET